MRKWRTQDREVGEAREQCHFRGPPTRWWQPSGTWWANQAQESGLLWSHTCRGYKQPPSVLADKMTLPSRGELWGQPQVGRPRNHAKSSELNQELWCPLPVQVNPSALGNQNSQESKLIPEAKCCI